MTKSTIDQKEYLKKYLRSDKDVKKKKKKSKIGSKNVKIIDDDIDLDNMRPMEDGEFDILNSTEDAPQIVGIVDERGPVDFADKRRWKIIADDGEGNVAVSLTQTKSRDVNDTSYDSIEKSTKKLSKNDKTSSENGNYNKTPPRKSRKQSDDDLSPLRKSRNHKKNKKHRRKSSSSDSTSSSSSSSSSDSSNSQTDAKRKTKSKKSSKNRKNRHNNEDSDLSPPRPRKHKDSEDLSPPRKSKKNAEISRRKTIEIDSDLTPKSQKTSRQRNEDSDLSPPRSRRRRDSDSDLSPPRKSQISSRSAARRRNDYSDMSPPRKSRKEGMRVVRGDKKSDSELSPPRRFNKSRIQSSRQNRGTDSDLSPPRNRRNDERDNRLDFRRRTSESSRRNDHTRKKSSRWDDDRDRRKSQSPDNDRRMQKTLDGRVAGLQDAKAMREETLSYKEREKEIFSKMSTEMSGEGRAPVLRDRKTGKKRNLEAEAAEKREKEKKQDEIDEKYAKWGRGLKQVDDHNEKLMDDLYEMSKPLARYADDVDLDARQRATEYSEDPMLTYIKDKQIKEGKRKPDAPTYEGSFMPNRFGIKPGHRWDGVDRSNGYEKKWFEARNARAAIQEEAYKWSTADM